MVNDLLAELEHLHCRQATLRDCERQLSDAGENDPASDRWMAASIAATNAEVAFASALLRNWPALAAFLREAVSAFARGAETMREIAAQRMIRTGDQEVIRAHPATTPAQEPVAVPAGELLPIFADGGIGARLSSAMHAYLTDYVFGLEDGPDHEPTEFENAMLEDFLNGAISDEAVNIILQEAASAMPAAPVSPPADSGESEDEMTWRILNASPEDVIAELREQGIDLEAGVKLMDDMADQAKALSSTPAPQPGGAVKVKALEWSDRGKSAKDEWKANTSVGRYEVGRVGTGFAAIRRSWQRDDVHDHVIIRGASSDEAKAAAQADYERRILSALDHTPPQPEDFAKGAEAMRLCAARLVRDARGAFGSVTLAEMIMALPHPTQPAGE